MIFGKDSIELSPFFYLMPVEQELLNFLIDANQQNSLDYSLYVNDSKYVLEDVSIVNSPTPVTSPTTRGGVYFSDKFAYKVKGVVRDLSIVPLLSKTMLGPNTDFAPIKITTSIDLNGQTKNFSLFTNLTNSMQNSTQIELNMILVNLESN